MNILLISQCEKRALKETRRIIDQFAERCGDRTWQTAITQQGLETLYKLVKKTARKNTAVACHWIRGKNKTELLWVVGNRNQFNDTGRVPTNRTKRKLVQQPYENTWRDGAAIRIISTLAALLHDIGKATIGFQEKLRGARNGADPYRHEWISLQLFILMIQDCKTNQAVLTRLMTFDEYQKSNPDWYVQLNQVPQKDFNPRLDTLPCVAKWLGWLIVSHHRMPLIPQDSRWDNNLKKEIPLNVSILKNDTDFIEEFTTNRFFRNLQAISYWVFNPFSQHKKPDKFWRLQNTVTTGSTWLKALKKWAQKAIACPPLMSLLNQGNIEDRFLLHFSRLCLMLGDHNFSSERSTTKLSADSLELIANTQNSGSPNQMLEEHLIGVAKQTAQLAYLIPLLHKTMPVLANHKKLVERTQNRSFLWQNRAYDLAKTLQLSSDQTGFFGINMASTGCGKTLANARIMYGLSDPKQGARFTIALGLRVLTLQTGKALRRKLKLNDKQLAILIGGNQTQNVFATENIPLEDNEKQCGSDSIEELVSEFVEGSNDKYHGTLLGTIIKDNKAKKMLFSPIVTCTIDHLTHINECTRGGKYILPTLRLLTSDLILDEPDDFDQNDLPALSRLVFSTGLFGRKVLLSSATLTPDLLQGLFDAYRAGREIWQYQQNKPNSPVTCAWFDEFKQVSHSVESKEQFVFNHCHFAKLRTDKLKKGIIRRKAEVMPLLDYHKDIFENDKLNFTTLANQIMEEACKLHHRYNNLDPKTKKNLSVGLIRLSHTNNLIALTKAFYQLNVIPENFCFHIVVYHAKQLLLLRNMLESKLDIILNRSNPEQIFNIEEIRSALDSSHPYVTEHIFLVFGTPITEVGRDRDHDYDWAIIEPSSTRSIIQLAGRVWRHRIEKEATKANISILGRNLNAIKKYRGDKNTPCYCRPGFESDDFLLETHNSHELIPENELTAITSIPSIPRINAFERNTKTLSGLEHSVMAYMFNTTPIKHKKIRTSNVVTTYWQKNVGHPYCIHLQILTPFRKKTSVETEFVCQYNADNDHGLHFCKAETAWKYPHDLCPNTENELLRVASWASIIDKDSPIHPWLTCDLVTALNALKQEYPNVSLEKLALQFSTVKLTEDKPWSYHPWFGFYQ